jgi:hypothetical protein
MEAAQAMGKGDFTSAMNIFDEVRESDTGNSEAHYGWAEAAFMRLSMDMEDDVPAALIMKGYKEAMSLDEDNLGYVSSFANFALDCGRIPMAIKEYQRLEKMADLQDIPVDDTLFEASRLIVEAIERLDPERVNPMVKPWLKQALTWAVGGLGYNVESAIETLSSE